MESSTKDILCKRLVQLRTERGWLQYDLMEKMFLSQRSISKIEKGNCTLSNLIQLADLYEVSLDYIQVALPREDLTSSVWTRLRWTSASSSTL